MKSIIKSAIYIFAFAIFSACDVVDEPIKDWNYNPVDPETVARKIVIEDITGHRCKNCPTAAKELEKLKNFYGDRIIGLAVHAGPQIFVGVDSILYPTDFTTPFGNQIFSQFRIPGLPMGMISRKDYTSTGTAHLKSITSWPSNTAQLIDTDAQFKLTLSNSYNASSRQVVVDVEAEALANMSHDVKICVMITESAIVAPQLMPDNSRNENYVHNDVLRTMFTQALGDNFCTGPIATGQKTTGQYIGFLSSDWADVNCDVVVYVFNADTFEILQAEVAKIAP